MADFEEEDDGCWYYLEINDTATEVTLTVQADIPLDQNEYLNILMAFIDDAKKGNVAGFDNWMFDLDGKYH